MSEYIPFGDEWKAEVMRMKKADIVDMLAKALTERAAVGRLEGERQAAMQLVTLWRTEGKKRNDGMLYGPEWTTSNTLARCAEALAAALAADGERGTDMLPAPACCASFVYDGTHHKDCRFFRR
jgi:hypothetical protein